MCTVQHVGCSAGRLARGSGLLTQLWQWCWVNAGPAAFITWQADCAAYLLPFDTDMRCLLVTDAAQHCSQRSQMTFGIAFFLFFFESQSIICLTIATNATPGIQMQPWVVVSCLLGSHLLQLSCVCVCVCVCMRVCLCVCVREHNWLIKCICQCTCMKDNVGSPCSGTCLTNHW